VIPSDIFFARPSLVFAWASSGDEEAGHRAEQHLDEMERSCGNRLEEKCPDTRSYVIVLSAWSKSSSFDKAERALGVLRRMERQVALGNRRVTLDEHAYSLVINACAFSNASKETELEAFRIAVTVFDEALNSKHISPEPLTYGWFLQACGRLRVPPEVKVGHQIRAFLRCCRDGLLTDFVLTRLRGSVSETLFDELVLTACADRRKPKSGLAASDLPPSWSRNTHQRNA
jgi:hypothetical protein